MPTSVKKWGAEKRAGGSGDTSPAQGGRSVHVWVRQGSGKRFWPAVWGSRGQAAQVSPAQVVVWGVLGVGGSLGLAPRSGWGGGRKVRAWASLTQCPIFPLKSSHSTNAS